MTEMNFNDRLKKFFDFELSLSEKELEYWDIFRHDISMILVFQEDEIVSFGNKKRKLILTIKNIFKDLINLLWLIFAKQGKRILFTCSRYNLEGQLTDVNMLDIYTQIEKDFIKIETYKKSNYIKALYYLFHKNSHNSLNYHISDEFINKINKTFNVEINKSFYEKELKNFANEYKYYKFFFNLLKPKSIYFIQNGIHKGMIKAAKDLTIPTVEIQHGEIGESHPAYYYPIGFKSKNVVAADYLFVWSEFWKKRVNFPGVKIISIGNSYYYPGKIISSVNKQYDFSIFSNTIHTPIFDKFLLDLFENGYSGKVCYKLHPSQINELDTIKERWKSYSNIDVILLEKNAIDVISESNAIFLIHSTVVFQALDMNCKVLLYTASDEYLSHKDILNHPNVYLVNNKKDFINIINKPINNCDVQFYSDFDEEKFNTVINTYNL